MTEPTEPTVDGECARLGALEDGWLDGAGVAPTRAAVGSAREFLEGHWGPAWLVPTEEGGLGFDLTPRQAPGDPLPDVVVEVEVTARGTYDLMAMFGFGDDAYERRRLGEGARDRVADAGLALDAHGPGYVSAEVLEARDVLPWCRAASGLPLERP